MYVKNARIIALYVRIRVIMAVKNVYFNITIIMTMGLVQINVFQAIILIKTHVYCVILIA
jgi:hypothetical protein